MRGCLNCDMNRPKPKPIEGSREDLTRAGFTWIETRKCKQCGHFIPDFLPPIQRWKVPE